MDLKELDLIMAKNMEKELILFPFDPLQVEKESEQMDWKKIKDRFDPFANIPILPKKVAEGES